MFFVGWGEGFGMYDCEESPTNANVTKEFLSMIVVNKCDILRLLTPRCGHTDGTGDYFITKIS